MRRIWSLWQKWVWLILWWQRWSAKWRVHGRWRSIRSANFWPFCYHPIRLLPILSELCSVPACWCERIHGHKSIAWYIYIHFRVRLQDRHRTFVTYLWRVLVVTVLGSLWVQKTAFWVWRKEERELIPIWIPTLIPILTPIYIYSLYSPHIIYRNRTEHVLKLHRKCIGTTSKIA